MRRKCILHTGLFFVRGRSAIAFVARSKSAWEISGVSFN